MAVEARVSVQAMKGRFEQLHEDGPLPANPSPTPRVSTSPLRLRSASVSGQVASSSALQQDRKPSERFLDTREEVKKHLSSRPAKADEGHKNKSFLAGFVSPAFMGSRGLRASSSSPKKNFKRIGTSELNLVERRPEDEVDTPLRRVSDGNGAGGKPSVVRRIPVFKSVEGGLDNNKGEEAGSALNGALGDHERKKVIGHGRSRSHGNFIITRDLGGDKDVSAGDKSNSSVVVKAKENIWNKDVIVKALRQKSSDNLFNNRDSRSDYSFEGKQKLVATVVKNMRNKEKPNVLRKFSFTSKTEKDLKNKKEKAVSPAKKDKQQVLPAASPDKKHKWKDRDQKTDKTFTSVKKIEIKAAYPSPDGKTSPTSVNLVTSDAVIATAAIAKAVADIAASKSEINVAESSESGSPPVSSSPPDPPARPPRRRTGFTPRKKGRAPSPPGPPGEAPQTHRHTLSEDEGSPSHFQAEARKSVDIHETRMLAEIQLSDGIHPDGFKEAHLLSTDRHKSSDSLATSKVSDRSRQSSPVMAPDNSPVWVKRTSVSSLGSSRGTSPVEGNVGAASKSENKTVAHDMKIYIHDSDQQTTYKYEEGPRSPNPYQDECTSDSKFDFSENAEPEGLPPGPPPKKPPRTFAYDIYRNSKVSRNAGEAMEGADSVGENSVSSNEKLNASPEPVYAVPVKKKKSDKKLDIKPPIRSNSDLTKRELVKPSVAPKPPHIVTKAKRASMVDPLSCPEKDEEAAMTSEFQRQAHIRYSLRRPKKPPPAPPQNAEAEGATSQDLGSSNDVTRARANSRVNLNCSYNSLESQEGHLIHPHARSCTSSPQDLNYSVASDVELSPTSKSFSSGHSIGSNDSDHLKSPVAALRQTSHSTYNLRTTSPMEGDDQPTSLIHCPTASPTALSGLFRKRSMSDETLYKGARHGEEPIYATPIFPNNKGSSGHSRQRELHYMCSVLFTDEEEADGGRDGSRCRRNSRGGGGGAESSADGNKGRAGIISVWKREFRQSCRHVQNKIKKTVIR